MGGRLLRVGHTHGLVQSPGPPFVPDEIGKGVKARIVFVRHGATNSSEDQLLMGVKDEEVSTLGEMQNAKTAELIMDIKVLAAFPGSRQIFTQCMSVYLCVPCRLGTCCVACMLCQFCPICVTIAPVLSPAQSSKFYA